MGARIDCSARLRSAFPFYSPLFFSVRNVGSKVFKFSFTSLTFRLGKLRRTLGAAKLSTKGQVTIPADARRRFNLEVGDVLLFIEEDGRLLVEKG